MSAFLQKLKDNRIWLLVGASLIVLFLAIGNMITPTIGGLVIYSVILLYEVLDNPSISWAALLAGGLMVVTFVLRLVIPQQEQLTNLLMGLVILGFIGYTFRPNRNTAK